MYVAEVEVVVTQQIIPEKTRDQVDAHTKLPVFDRFQIKHDSTLGIKDSANLGAGLVCCKCYAKKFDLGKR